MGDEVVVGGFQVVLVAVWLYAMGKDRGWFTPPSPLEGSSVVRGAESWGQINLAFGIASVVVMQIIDMSDAFAGYKAVVAALDITLLVRLFFFNGWFRNKTLAFVAKSSHMEEPLR